MEKVTSNSQTPNTRSFQELVPVYLWIFSIPLGIALQNLLSGIVFLLIVSQLVRNKRTPGSKWLRQQGLQPLLASSGLIIWIGIATFLNPGNPASEHILKFPPGYFIFCFFPPLFVFVYGHFSSDEWKKFLKLASIMAFLWGLIALSQALFGWRVQGSSFILEEARRPRGLYSHPLTLAYAAFFLWPLSVRLLFRNAKNIHSWLMFVGIAVILLFTQSRTIQAFSGALLFLNLFLYLKGRTRTILLATLAFTGILVLATPNPVSSKFIDTFSAKGVDLHSDYPDDRIAFWHAHWLMVKERPVTGHGFQLNTQYRKPYYEQLGLAEFKKQYEAHNMFLQFLSNGGIIALLLFGYWCFWLLRKIYHCRENSFFRNVALQTFSGFMITGLTQNSFQDASVRIILSIFVACCWLSFSAHSQTKNCENPPVKQ